MTDEERTELAAKMRLTLRDGGLLPAYTDESKGPSPQPPILQTLLEQAIEKHVEPLLAAASK